MYKLIFNLNNVHCEECRETIYKTLTSIFKVEVVDTNPPAENELKKSLYFYLANNTLYLFESESSDTVLHLNIRKIKKKLKAAGFKVDSWEYYKNDNLEASSSVDVTNEEVPKNNDTDVTEGIFSIFNYFSSQRQRKSAKNHLMHCKACRDEKAQESKDAEVSSDGHSLETVVVSPDNEYRAVFSVEGMTCSSCVKSISELVEQVLGNESVSKTDNEPNFSVNLLQHSIVAIVSNKHIINKITDTVNDMGFDCRLLEVLPVQRTINLKVNAILGGITCAACANSIQSAVDELPFVLESGINVVTKSGQFIMEESNNSNNLQTLKERIEDCGFDFEVVNTEKINYTLGKKKSRSIHLSVDGMFCNHCPQIIMDYLESYGSAIVINDSITLDHPFIKFTYIPSEEVNLRNILRDLNHLRGLEDSYKIDMESEGNFKCDLVKPVSMDEYLRKISRKEVTKIVYRLILATIFAIPAFIFGVVFMSLLKKNHPIRKWVEEPLWVGGVTRNTWVLFILSTPVYFFAADVFHRKAFKEIKSLWSHKNSFKKRFFKFGSMNLLMFLGTSVSYFASLALLIISSQKQPIEHKGFDTTYFDSVVFLTFFLLIGRLLEGLAKIKTADSIASLSTMRSLTATLLTYKDGKFQSDEVIDIEYLELGDYISIATGESPPVDCVITEGISEFDESTLTGESTPVTHSPGHQIFSGTVNIGNNSIIGKVISLEGESLIDHIIEAVREGQLRKAPIERIADTLTGYFVPIIVILAILTWVIWLALAYSGSLPDSYLDIDVGGWTVWSLEFAISVFVIACPCGIGLAAPTALFVGSGLAAKNGILAKGGGVAFQDGANIGVVCFDKTGTLTCGELKVTNYAFNISNVEPNKVDDLKVIATQITRDIEIASKHPIAKSVKLFIEDYRNTEGKVKLTGNQVPQVKSVAGKGLVGDIVINQEDDFWVKYKPEEALVGNESLLVDYGVKLNEDLKALLHRWKSESKSVLIVAIKCSSLFGNNDFNVAMFLACRDEVRPETRATIEFLQNEKNIECWMITGDNKITAKAIAEELGIKNVVSEVLPSQKQDQIKRIQQISKKVVAMVGDGINDAPALSAADVGIALSSGADFAVTSSDFILLNKQNPLSSLVTLLDLSKTVFRRVKFNFCWSLIYNTIGIPISAGVIYPYNNSRLSPVWASAAMAASSVSVVTSSLLLNLYRPKKLKLDIQNINDTIKPIEEVI